MLRLINEAFFSSFSFDLFYLLDTCVWRRLVLCTINSNNICFPSAHRKAFHQTTLEAGSDVRVRHAANEDYHHVLAIKSDVYWGRDYLPWRYHAILASPLYRTAVCQHKDAIVSIVQRCVGRRRPW